MIWVGIYLLGFILIAVLMKDLPQETGGEAFSKLFIVTFWPITILVAFLMIKK